MSNHLIDHHEEVGDVVCESTSTSCHAAVQSDLGAYIARKEDYNLAVVLKTNAFIRRKGLMTLLIWCSGFHEGTLWQ